MRPSSQRALRALRRTLSEAELRAFFADVRAAPDADLLAREPPSAADPTLAAVTALLAPFPQRSPEKAALLKAHLEKLLGRALPIRARGLAGVVKALKAQLSEDDIRDGAFSLRVTLAEAQTSAAQEDDRHES